MSARFGSASWLATIAVACLALSCGGTGSDNGGAGGDAGTGGPGAGGAGGSGGSLAPSVEVSIADDRIRVLQDGSEDVLVEIVRQNGFEGDVNVSVSGLPAGVTVGSLQIPGGSDTGSLSVTASSSANDGGPFLVDLAATSVNDSAISSTVEVPLFVARDSGELDTSFSFDGMVLYSVTDRDSDDPRSIVRDNDGRLIVGGVGQGAAPSVGWLVRFLPSGAIDPSFGTEGEVFGFAKGSDPESSVSTVFQRDENGLIVFASSSGVGDGTQYLRAFGEDGNVDTTFSAGGDAVLQVFCQSVVEAPSGYVCVKNLNEMSLLTPDGVEDPSFAVTAPLPTDLGSVAVDSQGRVVFGGVTDTDPFLIARLTPTGAPDNSFGTAGSLTVPLIANQDTAQILRIAMLPDDGGLALAASNDPGTNLGERQVFLIRFRSDGTVDPGFGTQGVARVLGPGELGFTDRLFVQGDGRIVVSAGISTGGFSSDPILKRFDPDGSVDLTFGSAGQIDLPSVPRGLVYDADADRVIVVGAPTLDGIELSRIWL
ncbi:MAG: hypothetical protein AAF500_15780 [Myxococcota bacterium]